MVLLVAFASLFAVLLGYSRIPYAAAADGEFLPLFRPAAPHQELSLRVAADCWAAWASCSACCSGWAR
jgi:hypothetical protein